MPTRREVANYLRGRRGWERKEAPLDPIWYTLLRHAVDFVTADMSQFSGPAEYGLVKKILKIIFDAVILPDRGEDGPEQPCGDLSHRGMEFFVAQLILFIISRSPSGAASRTAAS